MISFNKLKWNATHHDEIIFATRTYFEDQMQNQTQVFIIARSTEQSSQKQTLVMQFAEYILGSEANTQN
jgi:hypothetical protein